MLVTLESLPELPWSSLAHAAACARLQLPEHERISGDAIVNNPVLRTFLRKTKERGGRLHLIGMLGGGAGHTSAAHLSALIGAAEQAGVRVVVHAILDGVDPSQRTAAETLAALEARLAGGVGRIGTVSGRAWTVDAEAHPERIEKLYRAMMADGVTRFDSALAGVKDACQFGKPEGFVAPFVVFDYPGVSLVDSALHVHALPAGARGLARALSAPSFDGFFRGPGQAPFVGRFASMVPYDADASVPSLFPRAADPDNLPWPLAVRGGRKLWRAAPAALSAMTDATLAQLRSGDWDCAVVDLASPDNPARSAEPKAVRAALGAIVDAALTAKAQLLVTSSADADGGIAVVHVSDPPRTLREQGSADDLAPTLLELLQLPADPDSEGSSLLLGSP